MREGDNVTLSD